MELRHIKVGGLYEWVPCAWPTQAEFGTFLVISIHLEAFDAFDAFVECMFSNGAIKTFPWYVLESASQPLE